MNRVYYRDADDERLKKSRKLNYLLTLILTYTILGSPLAIILYIFIFYSHLNHIVYYMGAGIFIALICLGYIFRTEVRDARDVYLKGIVLTDESFTIGNEKIDMDDIFFAKVIEFIGNGVFLVLGYTKKKKRGTRKSIFLLRNSEAADILDLCNKIRELKNFETQHTIEKMSSYITYSKLEKRVFCFAEDRELGELK